MSSTFTQMKSTEKNSVFGGTGKPIPVYLQFVPGIVLDVATSYESAAYKMPRDINSIMARSHVTSTDKLNFKSTTKKRYYPLLRGQVDVPVKGDPVLLCTIGGVNYYLGPLNTANSPNWNIDHLNKPDVMGDMIKTKRSKGAGDEHGLSKNFTLAGVSRLQKMYNQPLDDVDQNNVAVDDIPGDMIFEGRFGNSIRIGSRDYKPYMMFSNGRMHSNSAESLSDDCTILLSSYGKISEHFPHDVKLEDDETVNVPFVLASDNREEPTRIIGGDLFDYEYSNPQLLQSSDRIVINSKKNSLYLSSFVDTIIGSGNKFQIISENETIIESSNIYLGNKAIDKEEPMVMGEQLRIILDEMLDVFTSLKVTGCIAGMSGPPDPGTIQKVMSIKQKIGSKDVAPFNSEYHFIEPNGSKS